MAGPVSSASFTGAAGYAHRRPTRDDLEAVADVLRADQPNGGGEPVLGADFIRKEWSKTGFDLLTDAWVFIDDAEKVIAYGQVTHDAPDIVGSWGVVHPGHRGRGIGPVLLGKIEQRATELLAGVPAARFRHAIDSRDAAAARMLEARGLRPVRHFWHMQIDLDGSFETGRVPAGIGITGVGPDDLPTVHAVLQGAFADDWGHTPEAFERWAEDRAANPRNDLTLWLLAREGDEPAGALIASGAADGGWVDELGVLPRYRGRGIGGALLRRAFAALAARGLGRALLNVDAANPTGATVLYERAGMRVADRWDLWERSFGTPE